MMSFRRRTMVVVLAVIWGMPPSYAGELTSCISQKVTFSGGLGCTL